MSIYVICLTCDDNCECSKDEEVTDIKGQEIEEVLKFPVLQIIEI